MEKEMQRRNRILIVIRHELRLMFADGRIIASVCLLLLVTGYGMLSGRNFVRQRAANVERLETDEASRREKVRMELMAKPNASEQPRSNHSNAMSPAVLGGDLLSSFAILPPEPLAVLGIGQSDLQPFYFRISTESLQKILNADETANPGHLLSGRLDLGFAMIVLYPLVILAIGYDMLSAEKENGTFVLTMSQPIRLSDLILGKVIARFLALSSCTLAISAVVLFLGIDRKNEASVLFGWAAWLSLLLLYGSFWFVLAVAVNLRGNSSASNALILSGSWLTIALILPSLINLAANSAYPTPSRIALIQATRQATIAVNQEGSRSLAEFYEDHPELSDHGSGNVDDFLVRSLATRHAVEASVQPLVQRFDESLERRQNLIRMAKYLSPTLLAQDAIEEIAGTGPRRQAEFLTMAKAFHAEWRDFFVPRIARKEKFQARDFEALPRFRLANQGAFGWIDHLPGPVAGLLMQILIVFIFVRRSILRFRVIA